MKPEISKNNYIANLDILRAIAAMSVCFFHFNTNSYVGVTFGAEIFKYGSHGVDMFFVISGYVMSLSLSKSNFKISDINTFLYKRFIRLYPAFVAAIAFVFLMRYLSGFIGAQGSEINIDIQNILMNLTLSCDFFDGEWMVPIFWTLAIEAQFYIILAFCFTMFIHRSKVWMFSMLMLWILAPVVFSSSPVVLAWTALFSLGVLAFLKKERFIDSKPFWLFFLFAFIIHWITNSSISAIFGLSTALIILYIPNIKNSIFIWVGTISYSLYLIHFPLGMRVMNISRHFIEADYQKFIAFMVSLVVSIIVAYFFYKIFELPSHRYSKGIKYFR